MKPWIDKITLTGHKVVLKPMALEHESDLIRAAEDGKLWELWFTSVPEIENTKGYIEKALADSMNNVAVPFVVIDKAKNKVVGSTRFMNLDAENKRLEIGFTWYAKSAQRTGINTECKFLLLEYAFEKLKCIAVEFRTHQKNKASRAAVLNIGAKQDGILRKHKIDRRGNYRDTVVFSITYNEWPVTKNALLKKMQHTDS